MRMVLLLLVGVDGLPVKKALWLAGGVRRKARVCVCGCVDVDIYIGFSCEGHRDRPTYTYIHTHTHIHTMARRANPRQRSKLHLLVSDMTVLMLLAAGG
jgi:hypothetical protein